MRPALERTLRSLKLDYVDLYIVELPMAFKVSEQHKHSMQFPYQLFVYCVNIAPMLLWCCLVLDSILLTLFNRLLWSKNMIKSLNKTAPSTMSLFSQQICTRYEIYENVF